MRTANKPLGLNPGGQRCPSTRAHGRPTDVRFTTELPRLWSRRAFNPVRVWFSRHEPGRRAHLSVDALSGRAEVELELSVRGPPRWSPRVPWLAEHAGDVVRVGDDVEQAHAASARGAMGDVDGEHRA